MLSIRAGMALLALVVAGFAGTAQASRIPSDTPTTAGITGCSVGGGCGNLASQLPEGWQFGLDANLFDNLYVYNTGLIGVGAPLPGGADATKPSTLGSQFLAPALGGVTADNIWVFLMPNEYTPTDPGCGPEGGCETGAYILYQFGSSLAGASVSDESGSGSPTLTSVRAFFSYGTGSDDFPAMSGVKWSANLPGGSRIGWNLGGQGFLEAAPGDPGAQDYISTFDLTIAGSPFGVPEPGTWLLLTMGTALLGARLRRQGNRQVLPA